MRIAILSANLGDFDKVVEPVEQELPEGIESITYHCYTDEDFPPITGLTPRLQYRIPKYFGWQMFPGYDYYIWLDGGCSFLRSDSVKWYLSQLDKADMALFKHPSRRNIRQEVEHIEEHLQLGKPYITPRYKNGLHKEQLAVIQADKTYKDDKLFASTTFIYQNNARVQAMMHDWWFYQSRYFTCDQVVLPWLFDGWGIKYKTFDQRIYQTGYMSLVSKHA